MLTKGVKRLQSILKRGNSCYSIKCMKNKGLVKHRVNVVSLTKKGKSVVNLFRR